MLLERTSLPLTSVADPLQRYKVVYLFACLLLNVNDVYKRFLFFKFRSAAMGDTDESRDLAKCTKEVSFVFIFQGHNRGTLAKILSNNVQMYTLHK